MTLHDILIEDHAWDGTTNDAGLEIIKHFEGWSASVYRCPAGTPTIGYGSIWGLDGLRITMDQRDITEDEGEVLFRREIASCEKAVRSLIHVDLSADQFSALVSWTYNLGSGRLQSSTLRAKLNRGNYFGASAEFPKWRRAGGVIMLGLVRRREAELALFDGVV